MVQFNSLKITPDRSLIVDVNIEDIPYYKDVYLDSIVIDNQKTYLSSGPSNTPIYKKTIKGERHVNIGDIIELNPESVYIVASIDNKNTIVPSTKFVPKAYTITEISPDGDFIKVKDLEIEINNKKFAFSNSTVYFCNPIESIYSIDLTDTFNVIYNTNSKWHQVVIKESELAGSMDDLLFVYITVKGTPAVDTPCGEDSEYQLGVTINSGILYRRAMNHIRELNCECTSPRKFIDLILRYKALMLCLEFGNYEQAIKLYNKYFVCENTHVKHKCHECRRNLIR
jgi:hypothetical protein